MRPRLLPARRALALVLVAAAPGCYLFSSAKIDETCEALEGGCAGDEGSDGADGADPGDLDGDGYTVDQGDCDDEDPAVSPAAVERCDGAGVDEDCDGLIDDEDDAPEGIVTHYADQDGDGWGDAADAAQACAAPAGRAVQAGDCADLDPGVSPDEAEACGDGLDNNCDGVGGCTPFEGEQRADRAAGGAMLWPTGGTGFGMQLADLDGDGRVEVAVATPYGGAGYGGVYIGQGARDAVVDLSTDAWGAVLGDASVQVGMGVALGRFLDGGDWGLVTMNYNGDIFLFGVDDLRGTTLGPWDARRSGTGLSPGSEDGQIFAVTDFTGDGVDELVVGAAGVNRTEYAGIVATFRGGVSDELSATAAYGAIFGRRAGSSGFGTSVGVGDLTGDGLPELLAGDPWGYVAETDSYDGYLTVFDSSAVRGVGSSEDADLTIIGAGLVEGVGWQLGVTDVNGDGYSDLYTSLANAGETVVFTSLASGVVSVSEADLRFSSGLSFGASGLWAGDLNDDGETDVVLGSLTDDRAADFGGSLSVRYGPLRPGSYTVGEGDGVLYGATEYGYFGFRTALGDVDGDGGLDIVARGAEGTAFFFGGGF